MMDYFLLISPGIGCVHKRVHELTGARDLRGCISIRVSKKVWDSYRKGDLISKYTGWQETDNLGLNEWLSLGTR